MYFCEECGSKERKVNVVGGRVLCHECTILELRRLDALDGKKRWVVSSDAIELLKQLVKDRVY